MTPALALLVLVICGYVFFKGSEGWAIVAAIAGLAIVFGGAH